MSTIQEYKVIKPEKSAEIEQLALERLKARANLVLTVMAIREIPPPEEEDISFSIRYTHHPEDNGMIISGPDSAGNSVTVHLHQDAELSATAYVVTRSSATPT